MADEHTNGNWRLSLTEDSLTDGIFNNTSLEAGFTGTKAEAREVARIMLAALEMPKEPKETVWRQFLRHTEAEEIKNHMNLRPAKIRLNIRPGGYREAVSRLMFPSIPSCTLYEVVLR